MNINIDELFVNVMNKYYKKKLNDAQFTVQTLIPITEREYSIINEDTFQKIVNRQIMEVMAKKLVEKHQKHIINSIEPNPDMFNKAYQSKLELLIMPVGDLKPVIYAMIQGMTAKQLKEIRNEE